MPVAVVSLHDVAPATFEQSRHWLDRVEAHDLRATLLVVPGPWRSPGVASNPAFVAWLRAAHARGHEVSLHGWEHRGVDMESAITRGRSMTAAAARRYGQLMARGCGEFHTLGRFEAKRRLRLGLEALGTIGLHPTGFTPPGWLISSDSLVALRQLGFRYTTTQWSVIDLHGGRTLRIPALSQRPASPVADVAATFVRHAVEHRAQRGRAVRVALHPDDLAEQALVTSTERVLLTLSAAARSRRLRVVTYIELVGHITPSVTDAAVA
jgi:predicted deacetylase